VSIDQEYYQEVPSGGVAEQLLVAARDRIFRDFISRMRPSPSDEILDVGVSDVINDGANVLERSYQHQEKITACGLGAGMEFKAAYPLCRYVQIEPTCDRRTCSKDSGLQASTRMSPATMMII
jgi:hypothetical protein